MTGIHVSCVEKLRDHYELERRPARVCEPYQMLGEVDEDLADAMGIDTVGRGSPQHAVRFSERELQRVPDALGTGGPGL